ncbi:MAG: enoyl-CoA hydratase [Pseudomonadota bacterium]
MPTAQNLFAAAFSIVSSAALFAYAFVPADKTLLL